MGMKAESTADLAALLAQAGWLRRVARALAGNATDGDDLAQETMLSALRRPAPGPGRGPAWLATVARNLAVDHFRGRMRRGRREEAAQKSSPGRVASPEELIGDAQIHRHVAEAVAGLAEPFRQTVVLRFYEGLSSAEIARRLGEPEGTIRWRLKEALDRVRVALDARYGDDRTAWQAALAPLLPVPRTDARAPQSGAQPVRGAARAASTAVVGVGAAVLAVVIVVLGATVARRWPGPGARAAAELAPSGQGRPAVEARAPAAARLPRVGLPDVDLPPVGGAASARPTPGRADAQSLAEELLGAVEANDYDAFVAKGSPWFRAQAGRDRLDAANAALAARLSGGHRLSTLGSVHRRRTIDWLFKLDFDDGGDDDLCILAMDGWQVAGFSVTEPIPQLQEK